MIAAEPTHQFGKMAHAPLVFLSQPGPQPSRGSALWSTVDVLLTINPDLFSQVFRFLRRKTGIPLLPWPKSLALTGLLALQAFEVHWLYRKSLHEFQQKQSEMEDDREVLEKRAAVLFEADPGA